MTGGRQRTGGEPGPGGMDPGDGDLNRLLVLVGQGDRAAFERVYDRAAAPVFGLVRRVLGDSAQAEEVTQEALLEIWRTAQRFSPERGPAITWMLTIAHRRAVDRVRAETSAANSERRAAEAADLNLVADGGDEVAAAVEARFDAERVRHCLDGLTELQRESIILAYYSGYSYPQVASRLDAPLGTIKTRIRDGLRRLRDCLGVSW
jgi:RNA polymerase sigma-70 factor (ECF subfamily)